MGDNERPWGALWRFAMPRHGRAPRPSQDAIRRRARGCNSLCGLTELLRHDVHCDRTKVATGLLGCGMDKLSLCQ